MLVWARPLSPEGDLDAHSDRPRAEEDVGGHEGAVFGEGNEQVAASAMQS
jgi:hypothetical protein